MFFKSLRDGDVFFKLASLETVKLFQACISGDGYMVCKFLRDAEAFFKLAPLRDG